MQKAMKDVKSTPIVRHTDDNDIEKKQSKINPETFYILKTVLLSNVTVGVSTIFFYILKTVLLSNVTVGVSTIFFRVKRAHNKLDSH